MFDLSSWDVKGQALGALQDYARRPVVFLVDGPIGTIEIEKAKAGSGTLVRTPRERTVVLTAKHNFEGVPPTGMSIGGGTPNGVSNALGARWEHPSSDVDLAVTMISTEAERAFGGFAVPTEVVAAATDTDFSKQNPMILCGYPALYRRTLVQSTTALHEFACASYATSVAPDLDAKGRYEAHWNEGALTSADPVFPAIPPGETFEIVHPRGISGGPLWRFRSGGDQAIFGRPTRWGRSLRSATDYNPPDHLELCTSVSVWGDWFRETIAKIDAQ
jgi:hypothetical protein